MTEAWPETMQVLTRIQRPEFTDCMKEMLSVAENRGAENVVKMFSTEKYLHVSNIDITPYHGTM